MVGAVYRFPDSTKLFGSVARKTRFPTLQQLFSGRSGNPELDAETSINYTVGVSRPFADIAVAELAFFFHDIEDWISRDGPFVDSLYRNYAEIEIAGLEFTTEIYPIEHLTLRFGYTLLDAEDKSDGRVTDEVVHMPEYKFDVGATYEIPKLLTRLDVTGIFVDESYSQLPTPESPDTEKLKSDDYYIFNTRVTQPFLDHFEAYVAVNNILDEDYESEVGFPAPGRNWWVGISGKF
jgi:outer membrane cobalamin receptor